MYNQNHAVRLILACAPDACGGYLELEEGTIQSPSYPDLYPQNKNCVWQIEAPKQHKITLNFTHFDLEGNNVSVQANVLFNFISNCNAAHG